jgi:tetratricopeptide (TPR) repeat protein
LSLRYREKGDLNLATSVAYETIDVNRSIASDGDQRHRADLALVLNNTSVLVTDASNAGAAPEDPDAALNMAREAVEIYEDLAADGAFDAPVELGAALTNLSNRLADRDQVSDAVQRSEDAVDVYRRLIASHNQAFEGLTDRFPSPHQPDLAASLHNLAVRFTQADRLEPAIASSREAIDLLGEGLQPGKRATWLNDLAGWLSEAGESEEAVDVYAEAGDTYSHLIESDPVDRDHWLSLRGRARNDQALVMTTIGRFPDAIETARRAWSDLLEHARRVPSGTSDAISTLMVYSSIAGRNDELDQALASIDSTLQWLGANALNGEDALLELIDGLQELEEERLALHDGAGRAEIAKRIAEADRLRRSSAPE